MSVLTLKIKLKPTSEQATALRAVFPVFNEAATEAARVGFEKKTFGRASLQKSCYESLREKFGLTSQLAIRAIGKAVDCFSRAKKKCPTFRRQSAVVYDQRIMSFKGDTVSLATLSRRERIKMVLANHQVEKLKSATKIGQADLVVFNGTFYLLLSLTFSDEEQQSPTGVLGVDLGVVKIATDSTGEQFDGKEIEDYRVRIQNRRSILQSVGTKSAKRRLKSIAKKEANYRRTKNHQISRRIVDKAKALGLSVKVEDLTHISSRTRFRKSQRATMSGWAFNQLTSFIEYKCRISGVVFEKIDPRNTSRTCSECGYCDKKNRKSQSVFCCLECRHSENADLNAAKNIAKKQADVSTAKVASVDGETAKDGMILS